MVMAKILPSDENSFSRCYDALNRGKLVAFPTETVYGLGANALNNVAVEKIFEAKKRPKTDPLIVHVAKLKQVFNLTNMSSFQKTCLTILANKFWPGPLTLIVKSSSLIPKVVTAGSEYVGIRIPNHPVALQLLNMCEFPLAAPSANIFGHVSPTSAQHVFADLQNCPDLFILDTNIPCEIGIESTILKIKDENEITLLRPGAISSIEMQNELNKNNVSINIMHKKRELNLNASSEIESSGQFLTHYSPSLESFILTKNPDSQLIDEKILPQSVLLDFNANFKKLNNLVAGYFDLSPAGLVKEASYNLFSMLRKAEGVQEAKYILLPDFSLVQDELAVAVFDRIYRATSGKYIKIE